MFAGYLIFITIDFVILFSILSLALVLIEKIYQTRKTVFHHISNRLEVRLKNPAANRIFNSLLCVWSNVVKQGLLCLINYFKQPEHALLSLTAGSRQNKPATWVVSAGYFLVFCVFLRQIICSCTGADI